MFGIAWSELLIIGIVALVVVPPKDLPTMLRLLGRWVGQMRRLAYDFQHQVNDALREAEIDDVKKSFSELTSIDPLADVKRDLEAATAPLSHLDGQMRSDLLELQSDIAADPTIAATATETAGNGGQNVAVAEELAATDTGHDPVSAALPGQPAAAPDGVGAEDRPMVLDPAVTERPVHSVAAIEPVSPNEPKPAHEPQTRAPDSQKTEVAAS
ncbi:MAG: Sec-independent protein translocase protein TatB [Ancalomicrobiaceae bacterium]|nr:Sec-independent protein translocase protein TatB [Ancalomicrobiaceae bacterium]